MHPQRTRIQEDLRGLISGEVRCDDVALQLYASDASIFQIKPLGIVRPRTTADVVACVRYAYENQIPVHARGAGSGLAGESLGPGIIIDFSRHLRRILYTGEETVRVQPGVVHSRLNAHLQPLGRIFGPDPATTTVTTMGSVIAIDGAGSHWRRYGSARRHVVSLQVVLADGEVVEVGREPIAPTAGSSGRKQQIVSQLADLLKQEQQTVAAWQPKSLLNRCGYQLGDVLQDGQLELAKLLSGSEGTLGLITEATLDTQALPRHRAVGLLFFEQMEKALRSLPEIASFEPSACDLMDRRHLSLARATEAIYAPLIPATAEAMLLVEQDGDDAALVRDRLQQIIDRVRHKKRWAFESRQAYDREEIEICWRLAHRVVPTLHRLRGNERPLPFVEDIVVPPNVLPTFALDLQNVLKKHQVTASLFAHAGHGQLHIRPFLDLADSGDVAKLKNLAAELYEAVWAVGGSISGEHGDGLSRTPFVRKQYGELTRVFEAVKRIFDPHNILNPGKIVGERALLEPDTLRPVTAGSSRRLATEMAEEEVAPSGLEVVPLQLNWTPEQIMHTARRCNGCGACRTQEPDMRMCPMFRFAPSEEASPRAKANMMRGILTGELDPSTLSSEELKETADLCINCQMCRMECPAEVDIPKLMIEAKAAYVATNGLRPSDWILCNLDRVGAMACRFSPVANRIIRSRTLRWILDKILGIAQGRKLPRYNSRTYLKTASKRRLGRPSRRSGRKVLFFVDTYANYHDADLADSFVSVLEHNGVQVYVPPGQMPSGMPMMALGALEQARKVAAQNVTLLAEAVRQGYHVVSTEPSAVLCLTREYPSLLDDTDAQLVAENTSEACSYLWKMHLAGHLQLDFKPVNATLVYHTPCHMKALDIGQPGLSLLRLIPALSVHKTERGCSGMAGTFGLKRENYRTSLRAGWGLISEMRDSAAQFGTTECSACKMQMEQGTSKPTLHPLKILALAYGLAPEGAGLLTRQGEELVVT